MLSDDGARCVPNCTAFLRNRRACQACGTVSVAITLSPTVPAASRTAFAEGVAGQIADLANTLVQNISVSFDGSTINVILPATNAAALNQAVNRGNQIVSYGGIGYTGASGGTATPVTTFPAETTPITPITPIAPTVPGDDGTQGSSSGGDDDGSGGATAAIVIFVLLIVAAGVYLALRK